MVDGSNKVDVDKLMSFSKDLVQFLKQDKDVSFLKQCIDQSNSLQSHCNTQYQALNTSIQVITDEINGLDHQRASIEEQRKLLKKLEQDQLRADLPAPLTSEQAHVMVTLPPRVGQMGRKHLGLASANGMKLSLYASVTSIIPDSDDQSKISGHIVERDKKVVENFEFDPSKLTAFDICNNIWKMINFFAARLDVGVILPEYPRIHFPFSSLNFPS
ncbi:putative protein FRIGIDA-like [Capsicum annuum]|nr:putative protein FRIGIDA-like [Capsicum annuum]KAF3659985.1 putative protein FRIGIDA-like [Capsicum annuum]